MKLSAFFFLALLICVFPFLKAEAGSASAAAAPKETSIAPPQTPPAAKAVEEIMAQPYVDVTLENISRTMWAMSAFAITDDKAVDDFLKINECRLYDRYYGNEFEWKKIRETTRQYLDQYRGTFPRRYEYVQPLVLGRYDFSLKGFSVAPESLYPPSTRLEVGAALHARTECEEKNIVTRGGDVYPDSVILTMKTPFHLNFVRVNEALAKEYLNMVEDKQVGNSKGRPAYIRFRLRLDNYLGPGEFAGILETIEVFADRELMFKLYEQTLY